jgi:hypothetical protein
MCHPDHRPEMDAESASASALPMPFFAGPRT